MATEEKTEVAVTTAKVKVIKSFRDKENRSIRFEVGTELEFETERAEDIVKKGLAQYVDPVA